ncbi:MAG: hypothetical protein M1840_000263 [Geoglossum simile]|nr:MAG: hypothetical protein M1840_000263 [Geoglossum simile]
MLFRSLTLFCSLALIAQGFLLPPSIPGDAKSVADVADINNRLIKLDCPGCLFAESDGAGKAYHWEDGVENFLFLNFSVDRTSPEVLTLNGVQLYPLQTIPPFLTALQVPSSVSLLALNTVTTASYETGVMPFANLRLGYELTVRPKRSMPEENDFEILLVTFRILGIEGRPVMGLDIVEMTLLRSSDNLLYIASLDKTPAKYDPFLSSPNAQGEASEEKECKVFPLLCKWKAILGDKLSGVKSSLANGCHKFRPSHAKVGMSKGEDNKGHSADKYERPHRHGHHHGHHRGHKLRKFFHQLKRVAAHIVVPVIIGIAAGMAASLMGMAAGFVAVVLWRKFCRGGYRTGYSIIHQSNEGCNEDYPTENGLFDDKDLPEYGEIVATSKKDDEDVKDKE